MTVDSWSDDEGAARAEALFHEAFPGVEPSGVWAAPGRVNVIGEHVDYNGGQCLPIALPHRTFVALRPRDDYEVRITSSGAKPERWEGHLAAVRPGGAFPQWVGYAVGVAWAMANDTLSMRGFDAAIVSCVPWGAGLSSSAAIEASMALALDATISQAGLDADDAGRSRLAAACVRAENEVVGAPTGGMDQAAALRTQAGHALLLDTLDHSVRQLPFDLDALGLSLLVIDTQAKHALVDGQYGARRAVCERVAERAGVAKLREVADPDALLASLEGEELKRIRHIFTEMDRVHQVAELLEAGKVREIGPLLDASHVSMRDDFEISCPELDVAVEAAQAVGALGARMTGGGFGGSAIALLPTELVAPTQAAVEQAFRDNGFNQPRFLVATPAAAGSQVK